MKTERLNPSRIASVVALAALGALVAGCSKDSNEQQAAQSAAPAGATAQKKSTTLANAPKLQGPATNAEDPRMANAVVTGKTSAAVDLKYDMATKPDVGQSFEVQLAFVPRLPADTLEIQVTGMPGLTLVSGATSRFEKVVPSQSYPVKVVVSAAQAGLYYIGVVAKMSTQVQSDARTFSVPLVVGTVPAAVEKPAPPKDATGRPIESMPAKEPPKDSN